MEDSPEQNSAPRGRGRGGFRGVRSTTMRGRGMRGARGSRGAPGYSG